MLRKNKTKSLYDIAIEKKKEKMNSNLFIILIR